MNNEKVFSMKFSNVYPLLVAKAERKGRTKVEVDAIISWLTGYNSEQIQEQLKKEVDYKTFFEQAPQMNPNCHLTQEVFVVLKFRK